MDVLVHADCCPCALGAGESYCNCGVAAAKERGATLGVQEQEITALRQQLRGAVDRAEKWERLARRLYALIGEEGESLLPGDLESSELLRDGGQSG